MSTISFIAEKAWLQLPVKNNATAIKCSISVPDTAHPIASFNICLATDAPDWFAPFCLMPYTGQTLTLSTDANANFSRLLQTDEHWLPLGEAPEQRPLYHFTATRGWNNDPNGLVFFNGEYHAFYQHNPYGTSWGNMHWGHAVSTDLVHWKDLGDALAPDELGTMYSGSAVIDQTNATGLGDEPGRPTLILIYTAASSNPPFTQCIASSQDGRTFKKYRGNPVVPNYSLRNRDPKVYWDNGNRRWIMAFYATSTDEHHLVRFMASTDMRSWTELSILQGSPVATPQNPSDNFLYECPDFFSMDFEGKPLWTVFGANGRYALGNFNGERFTYARYKETDAIMANIPGFQGNAYAAQTFYGLPDNRHIMLAWLRSPIDPALPFSQCLSIPVDVSLKADAEGEPRLAFAPVPELDTLFAPPRHITTQKLCERRAVSLGHLGTSCKLTLDITLSEKCTLQMCLSGIQLTYSAADATMSVNGRHFDWPLRNGRLALTLFIDRASIEIFSQDGFHYIALALFPADGDGSIMAVDDADATMAASVQFLK